MWNLPSTHVSTILRYPVTHLVFHSVTYSLSHLLSQSANYSPSHPVTISLSHSLSPSSNFFVLQPLAGYLPLGDGGGLIPPPYFY